MYSSPSVNAEWNPDLGRGFSASIGAAAVAYLYNHYDDQDCSYVDLTGGLFCDRWFGPLSTEFYVTNTFEFSQSENFRDSAQSNLVVGGCIFSWRFLEVHGFSLNPDIWATPYACPFDTGYHSYGLTLTYGWQPGGCLSAFLYTSGYFTAYFNGETDYTQYLGASAVLNLARSAVFLFSVTQTWNASSAPQSSYDVLDLGGLLTLHVRF
jgi:hypothetical protein